MKNNFSQYFYASLDKVLLIPTAFQIATGLAPLLFLKILFSNFPDQTVIRVEQLFAITIFCSVVINWSSNLFLARIYSRLLSSGSYLTILFNRFLLSIICSIFIILLSEFLNLIPSEETFLYACFIIFIAQILDPSWIYIGKKKLYIPQLQIIVQYSLATTLLLLSYDPIKSIAFSWLVSSIIFLMPVVKEIKIYRISLSLSRRIFRRFLLPTSSEIGTSLFSKLDVLYVASILSPQTAVIYIILRKHVLALQSVLFAALRLLYIETNSARLVSFNKGFQFYIILGVIFGSVAIYFSITSFFGRELDFEALGALLIFILGVPIGYIKNRAQFQSIYKRGLFQLDLSLTVSAFLIYVINLFIITNFGPKFLILMVVIRISCDLTYLLGYEFYKLIFKQTDT